MTADGFGSLVDLLRFRARGQADARAFVFLTDGEVEGPTVTYGELDRRSRAIAAALEDRVRPGDRALLLYQPGLEFIAAFFGCLYAGVVAVPAYPPHPARAARTLPRLRAIAADAGVGAVLSSGRLAALAPAVSLQAPELARARWLATDELVEDAARAWRAPALDPEALAFLQYTSGSTGAPKGVMVSHGNLLHNLAYIAYCAENDAGTVSVSWLPAYHDMGLIEGILEPVFGGYPAYLMSPASFLQQPVRWLRAISRYGATNSGGPNFAYDLCVRRTTPEERSRLDLGCWRVAYNGSEPIRRDTLEGFVRAFEGCGFRRTAFYPVYGLAEATLAVSSGRRAYRPVFRTLDAAALASSRVMDAAAPGAGSVSLVACGPPSPDAQVAIVRPDTLRRCGPGEVGEIWISSPSVARGYWNRPDETRRTFGARVADSGEGPFLRTGDLGFLGGGDLFVAGRIKDLIIIRGRKHYPQDIELTVERSHPAIRPGCSAAFAVPAAGGERAAVAAEVDPRQLARGRRAGGAEESGDRRSELRALVGAIRQAVAEEHEIQVYAVSLLAPGSLPRTSSGKLRRHECRAAFLAGTLEALEPWKQEPALAGTAAAGGRPA